jgi:hypothetical protein
MAKMRDNVGHSASAPNLDAAAQPLQSRFLVRVDPMADTQTISDPKDPRAVRILAKNIYREFRASGYNERDVMALAGELLALVTSDVKSQRAEAK